MERLQESLTHLLDEAGARTREEVDNVRKQCNQNISRCVTGVRHVVFKHCMMCEYGCRLMEEIHSLELDNSEKQAQMERILREKRATESELEKVSPPLFQLVVC